MSKKIIDRSLKKKPKVKLLNGLGKNLKPKKKKSIANLKKRILITIVIFSIIGAALIIISQAATPKAVIEPEDGTKTDTIQTITNDNNSSGQSYIKFGSAGARRFFSDSASWNKTVYEMGLSDQFDDYPQRLFNYAGASGWDNPTLAYGFNATKRGQYNLAFRDYSVPIYDKSTATTTRKMYWAGFAFPAANTYVCNGAGVAPCTGAQTKIQMPVATDIPWNPNWKFGTGYDRIMSVVDYKTGEVWEYWGTDLNGTQCTIFGDTGSGNWFINATASPSYDLNNPGHICMAGVNRYTNLYNVDQSNIISSRGMGIAKLALVGRVEEVEAGVIKHALPLTIYNQMFGPVCNPNSPSTSGAGVSCAFYLAPATKVEHINAPHNNACGALGPTGNEIAATDANRSKTIPSGMRFRVNRDDASIEQWLNSKGYTGQKRRTAKIIGKALVDYGFIAAAETGCGDPHFEFDGMQNPETKQRWLNLGLTDTGIDYGGNDNGTPDGLPDFPSGDLMHGFITSTNLQVVNPG